MVTGKKALMMSLKSFKGGAPAWGVSGWVLAWGGDMRVTLSPLVWPIRGS